MKKKLIAALLVLVLVLQLTACSGSKITLSEDGVASWDAVEGALGYTCDFVDGLDTVQKSVYTTDTFVQVPEGFCVHVRADLGDGEEGKVMISDFFGEPNMGDGDEDDPSGYVDRDFSVRWDQLKTYEVVASIDYSTLKTTDTGVYFEAAAPNGGVMRFAGTGVTVTEGSITFAPGARLAALDAMGRICAVKPTVESFDNADDRVMYTGGYTFTDETAVDSADDLFYIWGFGNHLSEVTDAAYQPSSHMQFQPNFFAITSYKGNGGSFTVSELTVYYDESTYHTGIRKLALETSFYGNYLEGEHYDATKEVYDSAKEIYDFYLLAIPDVADERNYYDPDVLTDYLTPRSLMDFSFDRYTIGDLKDAAGNVLDKNDALLSEGCALEVTLGKYTMDLTLPVLPRFTGAQTLHELIPYDNAVAQGEVTPLVVPIFWQDQPEQATDELLNTLRSRLGRVMAMDGTVTDYSDKVTDGYSLSSYFDIASYGKYKITSALTDWYAAPYNFADDMEDRNALDPDFTKEIHQWVKETYPDLDWSQFDRDGDGFVDALILVNAGKDNDDTLIMTTYSHAVHVSPGYTGEGAGTQAAPTFKNYISMNASFLEDMTLVHEFSHRFGLIDYYDVTYSGINAVGEFDMQSGSCGDWNAYSKYAVGWIEPEVVAGLESGASAEFTIGAFAATGDALVIPAAGTEHDGPFGEYMLLELFTSGGVNEKDAVRFGLEDAVGVRLYHVNSAMEKRVLHGTNGVEYPIGTVHYTNAYQKQGRYHLELLQAGGVNTFTTRNSERTALAKEDLFTAGDVFTAESYSSFLENGRMDSGIEFGYRVEIVRIGTDANGQPTATIRVTRQ